MLKNSRADHVSRLLYLTKKTSDVAKTSQLKSSSEDKEENKIEDDKNKKKSSEQK